MNIQIKSTHVDYTDELRQRVIDKIGHLDMNLAAHVVMSTDHNMKRVEAIAKIREVVFRANVTSDDIYTAIDVAADKLRRQLLKLKELDVMKELQVNRTVQFYDWNGQEHFGKITDVLTLNDDFGDFYLVSINSDAGDTVFGLEDFNGTIVGRPWDENSLSH